MRHNRRGGFRWLAILFVLALVAAACGGGTTETTEASGGEDTTTTTAAPETTTTTAAPETTTTEAAPEEPQKLLIWNKDETDTFQELVRQFKENNPGVELELVDRSFENYDTAVALAVAGDNPPDVLQVSYAYKAMGPFVKAGALMPLDSTDAQYKWFDRLGPGAAGMSFSDDGLNYGEGSLYGVAAQGEVVGVYYNKEKAAALGIEEPTTFDELEAAFATAEAAGELAINVPGATSWAVTMVWMVVNNQYVPAEQTLSWMYGEEGATFETEGNILAAQKIRDWTEAGYISEDALGFDYPTSLGTFGEGEGVFYFMGSWANGALAGTMGDNLGFFALPDNDGEVIAVTSTFGAPWAIGAETESPTLAAQFVDFVTGDVAAELFAQNGNLPGNPGATTTKPEPGSSQETIWGVWETAVANATQVNFIDQGTTTLGPVLSPGLQEVLGGVKTPEAWAAEVQNGWVEFHAEYGG